MQTSNKGKCVSAPTRVRLGSPEMRGTGISELHLISDVNETIKYAVTASEQISLIAINASLTAGRAGNRAAGFCVVATELRRFSERMATDMGGWSKVIYAVVRETATGRRQGHLMYKLQDTARMSEKACAALQDAIQRSHQHLEATTARNSDQVRELLSMIARTEKQYMTGGAIARAALIEAAYGGTFQPILKQIAETIGESLQRFTQFGARVGQTLGRAIA